MTGVSGSGKSTLINQTLHPALHNHFYEETKRPLPFKKLTGLQHLDKVIAIDQSPIGRTPRSNPATYTGVFNEIRSLFTQLPEAKIRGYKPGRFSFNVVGGRCETCKGAGLRTIEMNFLPDVHVQCEDCGGKRYNRETVEIRYRGKSISDVLDMTVEEASSSSTRTPRSNGSAARCGMSVSATSPSASPPPPSPVEKPSASSCPPSSRGRTPGTPSTSSTSRPPASISRMWRCCSSVLHRLVDQGNTVLVIEHQLDVACNADHIVDIGPEGGHGGGTIVAQGTPEEVANSEGATAPFLRQMLERP